MNGSNPPISVYICCRCHTQAHTHDQRHILVHRTYVVFTYFRHSRPHVFLDQPRSAAPRTHVPVLSAVVGAAASSGLPYCPSPSPPLPHPLSSHANPPAHYHPSIRRSGGLGMSGMCGRPRHSGEGCQPQLPAPLIWVTAPGFPPVGVQGARECVGYRSGVHTCAGQRGSRHI